MEDFDKGPLTIDSYLLFAMHKASSSNHQWSLINGQWSVISQCQMDLSFSYKIQIGIGRSIVYGY